MPDWEALFGDVPATQVVMWIVAAVLLVGVVIKLWPFIKNAVAIVDALVQLPEMRKQIASIHHETHTNNGSSIKDAVKRIEATLDDPDEGLAAVKAHVQRIDERTTREDDALWAAFDNTQNPEGDE